MKSFNEIKKNNISLKIATVGPLEVNCSLLTCSSTQNVTLIDPGQDESILSFIKSSGDVNIKTLIHTHAHFDHIGISPTIQKQFGSSLILPNAELPMYNALPLQGSLFNISIPAPKTTPDILVKDNQFLPLTTSEYEISNFFKVIHTPGHTSGSCCFYTTFFEVPILFSGDTLFKGSVGRTDLPTGSYEAIEKSITKKLFLLPEETIVIPGHGPCTTIGDEKKYNTFFGGQTT